MEFRHKKLLIFINIINVLLIGIIIYLSRIETPSKENPGGNVPSATMPPTMQAQTSVTPVATITPLPNVTVAPEQAAKPEISATTADTTSVKLSWSGSEGCLYIIKFREKNELSWYHAQTISCSHTITGLIPGNDYEFIVEVSGDSTKNSGMVSATTAKSGLGDPFENIVTTINVEGESRQVSMSSYEGCLGAKVWPQYSTSIYSDKALSAGKKSVAGGTAMTIAKDASGEYCYLNSKGTWVVYVADSKGNSGWINAHTLLIDLTDLFRPEESQYGIQINRTNAYRSIFTIGGSATKVDDTSVEESRYNCIKENRTIFDETGYNIIKNVTGFALPNYGAKEQMPVIWDMALEMIQCQKNALKSGCSLLVYEGYRPKGTSEKVTNEVGGSDYLTKTVEGRNLAKGYMSANYSYRDYIAFSSRHNQGIAVDLTIMEFVNVEALGTEMSMQTKIHTLDFRSNMAYNNDNADLLYDIMMTDTDLEPLASGSEWWHFQLIRDTSIFPCVNNYIYANYKI